MDKVRVLHISYHQGCIKNLNYIFNKIGVYHEVQNANWNYNIGHQRAQEIWEAHKDYYNTFDTIVVSDTCPLSRILLQNNYKGNIIIWICNRFDYSDQSTLDCNFPDSNYYSLIKNATKQSNVKIFGYTQFENEYAKDFRNIDLGNQVIKPCAFIDNTTESSIPQKIVREDTFFIPQYHNDTIFMNLQEKCTSLDINSYRGRYNGPNDLKGFKGIIHIPYAWSNLALFENWSIGNVYLIPSKQFLLKLANMDNFFWSPPFSTKHLDSSEWYSKEHEDNFIYFDDWYDLQQLSKNDELIKSKEKQVLEFSKALTDKTIKQWAKVILAI